jgi:hypothetical protein
LSLAGNVDEPSVPFWFTESYPDGDPRWEVAVLRPDPSLPFGGEWIQLTDLYAPTEEDPFNIVEMLCEQEQQVSRPRPRMVWGRDDEFVSFLGVDWRDWPNPTQGIFRIPITGLEIELLREDTPLRSFDDLETVVTIPYNTHNFEGFAWSPLGDKVAYSVTDYPDPSSLYIRTVDGSEPDRLVWGAMQGYRISGLDWSPDGTRLVFLTTIEQPSIVTIDVTVENQQPTVVAEGHQYRRAVWSPDSKHLALTIVEWQGKYVYSVGRVSAAGGRVNKLTQTKPDWKEVLRWTP